MNGEVSINRIMLYPMLRVSEISGVHSYYFSKVVFRINDLIKKIILKVHLIVTLYREIRVNNNYLTSMNVNFFKILRWTC